MFGLSLFNNHLTIIAAIAGGHFRIPTSFPTARLSGRKICHSFFIEKLIILNLRFEQQQILSTFSSGKVNAFDFGAA